MNVTVSALILLTCCALLESCGLDGVRGRVSQIDGEYYMLKTTSGQEIRLHVDGTTRKDDVSPGDEVFSYIRNDGHAEFLQRLN
jgi:hypothetical protein